MLIKNLTRLISGFAVLTMLFSATAVSSVMAAPVGQLDQEQASPTSLDAQGPRIGAALNQTLKQTFTAGQSGALTDVSVYGHLQNTPPPGDLVIQVTDTGGTVLASASVAGDSFLADPYTDRWITVSFASPTTVIAGTQYTLNVTSTQPSGCDANDLCTGIYYLGYSAYDESDQYPGGNLSFIDQYGTENPLPGQDLAFRTYVALPVTPSYSFSGFRGPVKNPNLVNHGKVGHTYPLKWQLRDGNGAFINALSAVTSIKYKATACGAFTSNSTGALDAQAADGTHLRYKTSTHRYIFKWATPHSRGCYTLFLKLDSGQEFMAYFNLTK